MTPIYKSTLISFINQITHEPIVHPKGDYEALNIGLKRLDDLIRKYQPSEAVVFSCQLPEHKIQEPTEVKSEVFDPLKFNGNKSNVLDSLLSMRGPGQSTPWHVFTLPAIGNQSEVTTMRRLEDFQNFETHREVLDSLVKTAISRMEVEHDDHPLQYNRQVQFRRAQYINNREAFSFSPCNKPFGQYPLTKPSFDSVIQQLDATKENYHICIDFVTDWKEQYSSFDGPPKSHGVELCVFMKDTHFPVIQVECLADTLTFFEQDADALDKLLAPMFENLSSNVSHFYQDINKVTKKKLGM